MAITVDATFENGQLKLKEPVVLADGTPVRVTITPIDEDDPLAQQALIDVVVESVGRLPAVELGGRLGRRHRGRDLVHVPDPSRRRRRNHDVSGVVRRGRTTSTA